jgi:hypothetical protein
VYGFEQLFEQRLQSISIHRSGKEEKDTRIGSAYVGHHVHHRRRLLLAREQLHAHEGVSTPHSVKEKCSGQGALAAA